MSKKSPNAWVRLICVAGAIATLMVGAPTATSLAQPAPTASAAASASPAAPSGSASVAPQAPPPAPAAAVPEELRILRAQASHVRKLLKGELEVSIKADSLFDIDISKPKVVAVEARRLAAVLVRAHLDAKELEAKELQAKAKDGASEGKLDEPSTGKPPPTDKNNPGGKPKPADKDADKNAADTADGDPTLVAIVNDPLAAVYEELRQTDPDMWKARVELDEARLEFYRLPESARDALLNKHIERQAAAEATKSEVAIAEVDNEAATAEKDKQAALELAKKAASEATRAVHEEHARLLGIHKEQAEFEKALLKADKAVNDKHDAALGKQRELTEAIEQALRGNIEPAQMDATYVELRTYLKASRTEMSLALDELAADSSDVPSAGPDRLVALPVDVDRTEVDEERSTIALRETELLKVEEEFREERARLLMAEIEMLNRTRLEMLPFLSSNKRGEVTGFGNEGLDQAESEVRQVWLTLRYHFNATKGWAVALHQGDGRGESAWTATLLALKWLLPVGLFIWWRRRAQRLLTTWFTAMRDEQKKREGAAAPLSWPVRGLGFLLRVHRPLEWLLLLWSVMYMLPLGMQHLLEVELISTIFSWTLGGTLVVNAIDALSSEEVRGPRRAPSALQTSYLRLKSLRLVGRAVVVFGLILAISSKLVGEGTIYSWVFSTCWFAAIPIALVIVKWWKAIIFERVDLIRKKGKFETWVLNSGEGAASFVAAIAAGAYLFAVGAYRVVRSWAVTFAVVRHLLAYLFRRGMSKKAAEEASVRFNPIDENTYRTLGPETASLKITPSVADADVKEVIARIKATGGGVFAVVGERGSGKSTLIKRIAESSEDLTQLSCPTGGLEAFKKALNASLSLDEDAPFEDAAELLDGKQRDSAILIDDAHHLILPMMGGLREFDQVLDLARDNSVNCSWIFAIDEVLWRFLERARGAKPLFDAVVRLTPWTEEGIVGLLNRRNDMADIDPSFEHLLTDLPEDADEVDIRDALERTEGNYYRLLWDYAAGNPGVALHFWRKSLGIDPDGKVSVRLFQAPNAEDLEGLPDSTAFVLRATVQLGWGSFEQICNATSLPPAQVKDALRYGLVKGYFERKDQHYHITWAWFRAITRFLKRRHLLFTG